MLAQHSMYAREKLADAISILATHPGTIRERLRAAVIEFGLVPRASIPNFHGVDKDVEWIYKQVTDREESYPGEGKFHASINRMRNARACLIAERIVTAHAKLGMYISTQKHG